MNVKQPKTHSAFPDAHDDRFDSEETLYEYMQEAAEATLHLDMHHRTPARLDNDAWGF